MILLGISIQANVIDVCLHISPAGNQFLYKGVASQDIWDSIHQLLKESRGIWDTEGHDLPAEDTALRGYKGEQFLGCSGLVYLPEATGLVHLSFESALSDLSRVFSMLGILPEWFWVFFLTSA